MTTNSSLTQVSVVESDPNYWALLLVMAPLMTALGNCMVILSVATERALQTSTNYLIVSLAVADFLVAILVMPWGIYVLMYDLWTLPFVLCDLYIAMDVICSTASIFNLVAISIDRYNAVSHPMKYSQEQQSNDHGRVLRAIFTIWFVSIMVGLPIVLGLNASPNPELETQCKFHNATFIIISSVASFYIPCSIILILYYRIMKAILRHDKEKLSKRKRKAEQQQEAGPDRSTQEGSCLHRCLKTLRKPKLRLPKMITTPLEDIEDEEQPENMDGRVSPTSEPIEQKGIASLMSNLIRMSTNPLEKTDEVDEAEVTPDPDPEPELVGAEVVVALLVPDDGKSSSSDGATAASPRRKSLAPAANGNLLMEPPRLKASRSETNLKSAIKLQPPGTAPEDGCCPGPSRAARHNLTVTFNISASANNSRRNSFNEASLCSKPPVVRSVTATTSSKDKSRSRSRSTFGTSIKVLRRAATWKIRSQERLQQKRERRERRATKTLGIVLGCFLFCWIPFFTCNILSAVSIKTQDDSLMPTMTLFMLTTWLGYMNSAINPLIYTLFNHEFRKAFKRMLFISTEVNGTTVRAFTAGGAGNNVTKV